MSGKAFLDTNILIYAYSSNEPAKRAPITDLIEGLPNAVISTQVVNELINVFQKKMKMEPDVVSRVVLELVERFEIIAISMDTITHALYISEKYRYSYFDSLMLASALEYGCHVIYTEDMHHGQTVEEKLIITNIFKLHFASDLS